MNHNILKRVILDQIEFIKEREIIDRGYNLEKNINYILVGVRRAGKTTMLYKLAQELVASGCDWSQIIYINFEDDRIIDFTINDFDDLIETAHELAEDKEIYYFLDEVQNIDGWQHFARRMADLKKHVYITGSNAKMLSSEMEQVLGGRFLSVRIMPFSFEEVLRYKGIEYDDNALLMSKKKAKIRRAFDEYMQYGGLPEALHIMSKREYIKSVYEKVILGDIAEREMITNKMALRLMMKKIAETVMHEISYNTLAGKIKAVGIKCSTDIMINYEAYAENAYLLFRTTNYITKFADREGTPRYYFVDNGFLSQFLVDKDSALLENAIAVYLKRKYYDDLYYYKSTQTGIDIDFYVPDTKMIVQVAYSLQDARDREVRSLVHLKRKSPDDVNRMIIVTMEEEEVIDTQVGEIEVIPAYKFLLLFW